MHISSCWTPVRAITVTYRQPRHNMVVTSSLQVLCYLTKVPCHVVDAILLLSAKQARSKTNKKTYDSQHSMRHDTVLYDSGILPNSLASQSLRYFKLHTGLSARPPYGSNPPGCQLQVLGSRACLHAVATVRQLTHAPQLQLVLPARYRAGPPSPLPMLITRELAPMPA